MTSPVGPAFPLEDPIFLLPSCNVAVTIGTLVAPATITGATLAAGTYTIHAVAHGLSTGMVVTIAGVTYTGTSATGPNGSGLVITRTDADHFTVTTGDAGTFTYVSGGTATNTIADTQASSLFSCGQFSQVTVGTGGTLYLQGVGDAAPVPFTVQGGQVLYGKFKAIGGPTTGSTAGMTLVASR